MKINFNIIHSLLDDECAQKEGHSLSAASSKSKSKGFGKRLFGKFKKVRYSRSVIAFFNLVKFVLRYIFFFSLHYYVTM